MLDHDYSYTCTLYIAIELLDTSVTNLIALKYEDVHVQYNAD